MSALGVRAKVLPYPWELRVGNAVFQTVEIRRRLRMAVRPAVKTLAVLLVLLVIAAGVRYMSFLDQMMVYFPERELSATPADVGLDYEDVSLTAADGTKLQGWHVPGESRTTLLWLHGNAGNISHRVDNIAMLLRNTGLGAFIIDYRGYGRSVGKPSEKGLYMDAEAAFEYLTSDLGLDPAEDIVLFGRSLGVGVAVEMATRHRVRSVVLESGFTSVREMSRSSGMGVLSILLLPLIDARYDSLSKIGSALSPVMVMHGDRDDIVPFEMAEKLFAAAPEPKRFYPIPGASHNDTYVAGGEAYFGALREFISESR